MHRQVLHSETKNFVILNKPSFREHLNKDILFDYNQNQSLRNTPNKICNRATYFDG